MNNKEFKYLAIGDSIAQGFNSKIGCGACGHKLKSEYIKGFSYGDYLTEFVRDYCISQKDKEYLKFWENFQYKNDALSVMRIADFHSLVNSAFTQEISNIVLMNKNIEKMANVEIQKRIWNYDNLKTEEQNFADYSKKFLDDIKESDLITISIGGNEFQSSVPFSLFRSILKENNYFKQLKLKKQIFNQLDEIANSIIEQYRLMVRKIKELNGKAKILLISYIPPFLTFSLRYEEILKKINPVIYNDLFKKFISTINKINKVVAEQESCYWIKAFDFKFWKDNSSKLCENTIDVHPSELGYQEIARKTFKLILEQKLIFDTLDEKYYKKIKNFSIKNNVKISNRNNQQLIFPIPNNINKIVYILRSWLDSKNNIQNPYFALLKREVKNIASEERDEALIISREEYTSLSSLALERVVFILKYLPKDSQIVKFIKESIFKDENILAFLAKVLLSESIIKVIASIESIFKRHPKQKLSAFFNTFFKENQGNFYNLFLELLDKNQTALKMLDEFIRFTLVDFENHLTPILPEKTLTNLIKIISYDSKITLNIKELLFMFRSFLDKRYKYANFDAFFISFIRENELLLKKTLFDIIKLFILENGKSKENFANILLSFLNIPINNLNHKEWNKLNKIIDLILEFIESQGSTEHIVNLLYNATIKSKLFDSIDFKQLKPFKYFAIIAKRFSKTIGYRLFNKYNWKIIKIIFKLLNLKLTNKMRRAFKIFK